jgi:hypothetical protein
MGVWERRYYRVLNAVLRVLLRSPLHGLRSGSVLLLEFHGRRSHKRYRIPVSYWRRAPGDVVCLTSGTWSQWWRNLDGADVSLWLRGRKLQGYAKLVTEPNRRRELVAGFLQHNTQDAQHYGVATDAAGRPLEAGLDALADSPDTHVIDIAAEGAS